MASKRMVIFGSLAMHLKRSKGLRLFMKVSLHPHAQQRLLERGALESEVIATVQSGERFPAKYNRTGFRRNFPYNQSWRGKIYATKQLEIYAVEESGAWLVITVITKFF